MNQMPQALQLVRLTTPDATRDTVDPGRGISSFYKSLYVFSLHRALHRILYKPLYVFALHRAIYRMNRPEPLNQPQICHRGHLCVSAIVSAFAFAILAAAFANNNHYFNYFSNFYYQHPPPQQKERSPVSRGPSFSDHSDRGLISVHDSQPFMLFSRILAYLS